MIRTVAAIKAERDDLREQLDKALHNRPDDTESHQRLMRLLSWNRSELQSAIRRRKVALDNQFGLVA